MITPHTRPSTTIGAPDRRLDPELVPAGAGELGLEIVNGFDAGRCPRLDHPRSDRVAAEGVDTVLQRRRRDFHTPVADDPNRVAVPPQRGGPVGAEELCDLRRHLRDEVDVAGAGRNQGRDAPQRRLLVDEPLQFLFMPFEPVLEEQSRAFTHVTTLGRWVRRYEGAAPLSEECPQRDSNPRYHLERVAT